MPELPEVEVSRLGISPFIEHRKFKSVIIREKRLRWPVPSELLTILPGLSVKSIERRGKYLLLSTSQGTLILHLGMTGNLRITNQHQAPGKHDHIDFIFENGTVLRFNDQRKFGAVLWCADNIQHHPLLKDLGVEPLSDKFNGHYLKEKSKNRNLPVKSLMMDSHIVVGIGNIYASESLFMAGILPMRAAGAIDLQEYRNLSDAVKTVLHQAIAKGGTTLRDFINAQGKPGYFQQSLCVYGRQNQPCLKCNQAIQHIKINQRASYFCSHCQS